MLGARTADQHVAAVTMFGQQRQQVAGGEQVRQQVFVQAPAQELLRLVDQPPPLAVAEDRGAHARYRPADRKSGVSGTVVLDRGNIGWSRSIKKKLSTVIKK